MRVLLDENLDRRLKSSFDEDLEVLTVAERGWSGAKNGALVRAAATEFDVLVTMDKNLEHQQNLARFELGFVLVRAASNRRHDVEPLMPEVNTAVREVAPGQLILVGL